MRVAAAAALAALAAVTPTSTFPKGAISPTASHEVPALDRALSALAGRHVTANCWSNHDWDLMIAAQVKSGFARLANASAFTNIELHQVQVSPFVCETLAKVLGRRPAGELDTALAVEVLAHEARHAAGVRSESEAECGGMRTTPRAAELLGLPRASGERLMHVFRGTVYPSDDAQYKSASCRAGMPGLVVANQFGPDAAVALLRSRVRAVGSVLGWKQAVAPPGPLSPCSPVRTREHELARVEGVYVRDRNVSVDVSAAILRTRSDFAQALARTRESFTCIAAQERRLLHRTHPHATFTTSRLPGLGYRTTVRMPGASSVTDLYIVALPGPRVFAAVMFQARGGPPSAAAERRALQAIRS